MEDHERPHRDEQHIHDSDERKRERLPQHQLDRPHGRHHQLLHGADLFLADDCLGRQHQGDHHKDVGRHSRHKAPLFWPLNLISGFVSGVSRMGYSQGSSEHLRSLRKPLKTVALLTPKFWSFWSIFSPKPSASVSSNLALSAFVIIMWLT